MNRYIKQVTFLALIATFAFVTSAQAQVRAYRVSDRQVETLLARIAARVSAFI